MQRKLIIRGTLFANQVSIEDNFLMPGMRTCNLQPASSEEDESVTEGANEKVCIDEHAALAALDGQRELFSELAKIFCEDCPVLLQELQAAVDAGDADNARLLTHSLKGLAATFYAQPTLEWATRLEQEAAEGRLQAFADGGLKRLSNSVMSLIDLLKDRDQKD